MKSKLQYFIKFLTMYLANISDAKVPLYCHVILSEFVQKDILISKEIFKKSNGERSSL